MEITTEKKISKHHLHDKAYKELFENKEIFIEFLHTFIVSDQLLKVEIENLIRVDKEFLLKDYHKKEADIVYRLKLEDNTDASTNGKEVLFYIIFELQSTVDHNMSFRLLDYMVQVWNQEIKNKSLYGAKKQLPQIVPIVFYNGGTKWHAPMKFNQCVLTTSVFQESFVDSHYLLVDVNTYSESQLLEMSNTIALIVLLDQKVKGNDIKTYFHKIEKINQQKDKIPTEKFALIINFLKVLVENRLSKEVDEETRNRIIKELKEEKNMPHALDLVLDHAIELAKEKALVEGKIEGKNESKIEIAKAALLEGASIEFVAKITQLDMATIKSLVEEK